MLKRQATIAPKNAIRKVTVRFTLSEYERLVKAFEQALQRKLSQYIRDVLLCQPIKVNTRNQSIDGFVFEMVKLRTELSAIGKNINQAVKKLHSFSYLGEVKSWTNSFEQSYAALLEKVIQINTRIAQFSDTWSPESPP